MSRHAWLLAVLTLWTLTGTFVAHAGDNTWSSIGPDGGYITKIVFHNASSNLIYALGSGGFFRSTDGGAHWQQPGLTSEARDFAVDPTNNNRIYMPAVEAPARILISTDAGATFSTHHTFNPSVAVPIKIVVSTDGSTLYTIGDKTVFRSTDRGRTFEQRATVPTTAHVINKAVIDPTDANTLYVISNIGVEVTHDGGATWSSLTPPLPVTVSDLVVDPTNPDTLWAATSHGLQLSTDGGATWSTQRSGHKTAVALDPQAPATVYVAGFSGDVLKRSSGAWLDITSDLGSFGPWAITVSPHSGNRLVVTNARGLWLTTDGGTHWARSDAGLVSTDVYGFAVAPDRVYTWGNALTRFDHGSDVAMEIDTEGLVTATSARASHIAALTTLPESNGGLLVGVINKVGRTLDDGASWSPTGYSTTAEDRLVDLDATSSLPSVYYASSQLTLQRSTDQGATWTPIMTGLPSDLSPGLIAIAPSNPAILYAGPRSRTAPESEGKGLYKSTDGGNSWTPVNTGFAEYAVQSIAVHPTNPDIVYVGIGFLLKKTVDGGATWTDLQWHSGASVFANAIVIDPRAPDTVYVAGNIPIKSNVLRSTDGGATWLSLVQPATPLPWGATALAIDTSRPETLRVGTTGSGILQMNIRPQLHSDLAIEMTPLDTGVPLFAPTQFRFTVRNLGPGTSGDVTTSIELPPTATDLSVSPGAGSCLTVSNIITCTAPPLAANASVDIVVTLTPQGGAWDGIVASVNTGRFDPQLNNNTASKYIQATERSDLAVMIEGPTTAQRGNSVQYIVTVTNLGPSPASNARVSYAASSDTTLGTSTITTGSCSNTEQNGVTCEIGQMASGATVTLVVNATVASTGSSYEASASVEGGQGEETNNNTARVSTTVTIPPVTQPETPSGGNSGGSTGGGSGGGGGGGATTPWMLLGLLALLARRKFVRFRV